MAFDVRRSAFTVRRSAEKMLGSFKDRARPTAQLNPTDLQEEIKDGRNEKGSGGYARRHSRQPPNKCQEAKNSNLPTDEIAGSTAVVNSTWTRGGEE